jgi:perosamine synthetase
MDSTRRYYFPVVGYNYRLSNLAAALLYAQFSRRGDLIERRNRVVHTYREGLKKSQKVVLRRANPEAVESPWLETMLVSDGLQATRDRLCQQLDDAGIETRPIFIPIHTLPPYQGSQRFRLDVTEVLGRSGFSVPTHPNLSESEIHEVIQRIEES